LGLAPAAGKPEDAGTAMKRAALTAIGVLPPQPKQNIFQIAHRNFRSYQKWRNLRQHHLAQNR
jgi:hypothetical protein